MHYERIVTRAVVLVHEHARALITKQYILILVNYVKLGCDTRKRAVIPLGRIKKFLSDKELYLITLRENVALLTPFAIYLDLLCPYVFVHKRCGQPLYRL